MFNLIKEKRDYTKTDFSDFDFCCDFVLSEDWIPVDKEETVEIELGHFFSKSVARIRLTLLEKAILFNQPMMIEDIALNHAQFMMNKIVYFFDKTRKCKSIGVDFNYEYECFDKETLMLSVFAKISIKLKKTNMKIDLRNFLYCPLNIIQIYETEDGKESIIYKVEQDLLTDFILFKLFSGMFTVTDSPFIVYENGVVKPKEKALIDCFHFPQNLLFMDETILNTRLMIKDRNINVYK